MKSAATGRPAGDRCGHWKARVTSAPADKRCGPATSCMSADRQPTAQQILGHQKEKAALENIREAEGAREFVDTNVLLYAFDTSAGDKHTQARELLSRLWQNESGCLSMQVLAEFFVTITRRVAKPLGTDEASERVCEFATWKIFRPGVDDVLTAITRNRTAKLNFWDAMIVESASQAGCAVLWTEDLNHGQTIRGVEIRNPFRPSTR